MSDIATRQQAEERPGERLRVGFLVHDFPINSETFVINQARGLVGRGHDLTILSLYGRGARAGRTHGGVERAGLQDRAAYAPMGSAFLDGIGREDGLLPSAAWRGLAFANEAALFARQPAFDVVHCQFASLGLIATRHRRARTLRCRRLVVHVRGYDISAFVRERGADVYDALFAEADLFMANCEHFRDVAIGLGCPPSKIMVVGSGLDTISFPMKDYEPPREAGPARLVTVGRLTEKKGLPYVLDALAALARDGTPVSLDIVGEGELREALEAQIERLDLTASVRLLGERTHEEIAALLRASDVFIAASVSAASGDQDAPVNSLKEAMASGLPVVATRHGGIPELVKEGENGLLVPERDAPALADAIRRLLAQPERWEDMGRAGRARTIAQYDQEMITDRIIGAYRQLLEEGTT